MRRRNNTEARSEQLAKRTEENADIIRSKTIAREKSSLLSYAILCGFGHQIQSLKMITRKEKENSTERYSPANRRNHIERKSAKPAIHFPLLRQSRRTSIEAIVRGKTAAGRIRSPQDQESDSPKADTRPLGEQKVDNVSNGVWKHTANRTASFNI